MLMGEYAVLHDKPALAFAIDKRITVAVRSRQDDQLVIQSDLGEHRCSLNQFTVQAPFEFALAALNEYRSALGSGVELNIRSQFSDKVGFGSSAAVVVATLKAMGSFLGLTWTLEALFQTAKKIVQQVQGTGSGTDVAASVYGGLVFYQPLLQEIERLDRLPSVVLLYAGYKTPTREAIRQVKTRYVRQPQLFDKLFEVMEACTLQAYLAVKKQDWGALGELMNIYQGLQAALGVSDPTLERLIYSLRSCSGIYGAKISGAGLGDCVMGLGTLACSPVNLDLPSFDPDFHPLPVQVDLRGVLDE